MSQGFLQAKALDSARFYVFAPSQLQVLNRNTYLSGSLDNSLHVIFHKASATEPLSQSPSQAAKAMSARVTESPTRKALVASCPSMTSGGCSGWLVAWVVGWLVG